MAASVPPEQSSPNMENLVSSFAVGIMTVRGYWVGICIKFAMCDKGPKLTHWSPHAYRLLVEALDRYSQYLGADTCEARLEANPSLLATLPTRHPYNTLHIDVPMLTNAEISIARFTSLIDRASFVTCEPLFELRPVFNDGHIESINLHEYTALTLRTYLQQYTEAADKLSRPAAGRGP